MISDSLLPEAVTQKCSIKNMFCEISKSTSQISQENISHEVLSKTGLLGKCSSEHLLATDSVFSTLTETPVIRISAFAPGHDFTNLKSCFSCMGVIHLVHKQNFPRNEYLRVRIRGLVMLIFRKVLCTY